MDIVEFPSQGAVVRGRFYTPEDKVAPHPIVIMAHGFTATINNMSADKYAEEFCKSGFAVLLYDHRNFGISDGLPRQEINKWLQARGYVDAINYVCTLRIVDKENIALWGDSMSGAEVLLVASVEKRVKAIVVQVPACGDSAAPVDKDGTLGNAMIDFFLRGDITGKPEITTGPLPVVSSDQQGTPSLLLPLTAFRWFIEYGGRYNTHWKNAATLVNPNAVTAFHPGLCAKHIKAAVLMMIAEEDEMPAANSSVTRMVFDEILSPKELIEMDGGHFGLLYYPGELFDKASKAQCNFLKQNLQS
ncbi:MAG: alpha/beta fold hydrolase [Bacteroidota bacterium]|nr:alpha/beta fold hydrolase [Bacteroidota bacterium]